MVTKIDISLTSENYFEVNEYKGLPMVSNSALSWINPSQGGSPLKFKNWWEGQLETPSTPSLRLGSLFHKWAENSEAFIVAPGNRPSDTLCEIAEYVYGCIDKPVKLTLASYLTYIDEAAETIGYGQNWKTETVRIKVVDAATDYFEFLKNAEGRHIFSPDEAVRFDGMKDSVEKSIYEMPIKINPRGECYREFPIPFVYMGLPCKALIDLIEVEHDVKKITIYDFKTTSSAVSKFMGSARWVNAGATPQLVHEHGAFTSYRYYRQMAFYKLAVQAWAEANGWKDYSITNIIYAIETKEPYEVEEFIVPDAWMNTGVNEVQQLMIKVNRLCDMLRVETF